MCTHLQDCWRNVYDLNVYLWTGASIHTFRTPSTMTIDINMVIDKLTAKMIFTIHRGSQSKMIVWKSTRLTNSTTRATMASKMAPTPEMMDPVLSGKQRQHVFSSGPAMAQFVYVISGNRKKRHSIRLCTSIFMLRLLEYPCFPDTPKPLRSTFSGKILNRSQNSKHIFDHIHIGVHNVNK